LIFAKYSLLVLFSVIVIEEKENTTADFNILIQKLKDFISVLILSLSLITLLKMDVFCYRITMTTDKQSEVGFPTSEYWMRKF